MSTSTPPRREHAARRRPTSAISLADALLANHHLRPGPDTRREIMDVLGLVGRPPDTPAGDSVGAAKPSSRDRIAARGQDHVPDTPAGSAAGPARPRRGSAGRVGDSSSVTLVQRGGGGLAPPTWLGDVDGLGPLVDPYEEPHPRPLFGRVQRRAILSAMVATPAPDGPIDVSGVIQRVSRARPLVTLPRHPIDTTRRGAQVLVDASPAMAPFRIDRVQLLSALDDVLCDDELRVHRFVGCPTRGLLAPAALSRSPSARLPWRPPPTGRPVVVLTSLGLSGPLVDPDRAGEDEWVAFARRVRAAGHPLVGLVPHEASRWPARITRLMPLVHWSERTTAGEVRNSLRDRRRLP